MKLHERVVMAAVVLGILTPAVSMAASLEAGFGAASALTAARRERNRQLKTPAELLREADEKDEIASLPPPTEKEACEGIFKEKLLVTSPKTGNKYCITLREEGGRRNEGGGHLKSKFEIDQEVALLDYWAEHPTPPLGEKEECEGIFKEKVFIISPKTGNKYCLNRREEGGRRNEGGGHLKSQFEIDQEVALLDYWAQNPAPDPGPQKSCEAFGDKVYVKSSKGVFHCLEKYTDN